MCVNDNVCIYININIEQILARCTVARWRYTRAAPRPEKPDGVNLPCSRQLRHSAAQISMVMACQSPSLCRAKGWPWCIPVALRGCAALRGDGLAAPGIFAPSFILRDKNVKNNHYWVKEEKLAFAIWVPYHYFHRKGKWPLPTIPSRAGDLKMNIQKR